MTRLASALRAAQLGWCIFPVAPREKTPHKIRPNAPYTIRWSEAATTNMSTIASWWAQSPDANIGIACRPSGLLVLDCDVAKRPHALRDTHWGYLHDKLGAFVDGDDVLREMCQVFGGGGEYDRLMQTFRVCTASLGAHIYLRWPDSIQASQASPASGALDVRGNGGQKGGYVLGAGSQIEKGAYVVEHDAPVMSVTEFPWLVELCREKPRPKPVKPRFSQPGNANYAGLVEAVRYAGEGNRNNCLLWAARSMCEDGATEDEAVAVLLPAAAEAGLFDRDIRATIRSAYRLQGTKT